jgi:hypothetical protein
VGEDTHTHDWYENVAFKHIYECMYRNIGMHVCMSACVCIYLCVCKLKYLFVCKLCV